MTAKHTGVLEGCCLAERAPAGVGAAREGGRSAAEVRRKRPRFDVMPAVSNVTPAPPPGLERAALPHMLAGAGLFAEEPPQTPPARGQGDAQPDPPEQQLELGKALGAVMRTALEQIAGSGKRDPPLWTEQDRRAEEWFTRREPVKRPQYQIRQLGLGGGPDEPPIGWSDHAETLYGGNLEATFRNKVLRNSVRSKWDMLGYVRLQLRGKGEEEQRAIPRAAVEMYQGPLAALLVSAMVQQELGGDDAANGVQ
eukprot:gene5221-6406_t